VGVNRWGLGSVGVFGNGKVFFFVGVLIKKQASVWSLVNFNKHLTGGKHGILT
jgi:hypothetical protein